MKLHRHLNRLSSVFVDQPLYFITTCAHDRCERLFTRDYIADVLVNEWMQAKLRHGWAIGSYVIMPDHAHFFCRAYAGAVSLSKFMNSWKLWTSKRINQYLKRSGQVWQKGFFDHILRSEESSNEKWIYVQNNPVRAGFVECAEDWKYQGYVHFR